MDRRMPIQSAAEEYFQHNHRLVQRHRNGQLFAGPIDSQYDYLTTYLKEWVSSPLQSLIMVHYPILAEESLKGLCVDLVGKFKECNIPVIWLMRGPETPPKEPITTHLLRSLTMQVMQLPGFLGQPEAIDLMNESESYWYLYLGAVLAQFENIFIVIDSTVLSSGPLISGNPWITTLLIICENHRQRFSEYRYPPEVGVKVALAIRGRGERGLGPPGPQWEDHWSYVDIAREEESSEQRTVRRTGNWLLAEVIEAYNDRITGRSSRNSTGQPSVPPSRNTVAEPVKVFPGSSFGPPTRTGAPNSQPRAVKSPFVGIYPSETVEQRDELEWLNQEWRRKVWASHDEEERYARENQRERERYRRERNRDSLTRYKQYEEHYFSGRERERPASRQENEEAERYLRRRDMELLAQRPVDRAEMQIAEGPSSTLRHHSSAYSLQTQPNSNSIMFPISTQPGPSTTSSNLSPYNFSADNLGRLSLQDLRQSSDVRPIATQVPRSQFPTAFSQQSQEQPAGSQQTSSTTKLISHKADVLVSNFELFDNQKPSGDAADKADKADVWFKYLRDRVHPAMPPIPKKEDRIGIAVLDTGIYMKDDFIDLKENRTRVTYQSFVTGDTSPKEPSDLVGHGTHAAGLLLCVAPNAEIYVAKISDTDGIHVPQEIANAIRHAVDIWHVHIISMSFGFDELTLERDCIRSAILHAHYKGTVLFAAARNNGGLKQIAYPASETEVICINSTDGEGNPSSFNPSSKNDKNFGTVGEAVLSSWPHSGKKRMTGTSFATPIAAGIAAFTMDFMEQKKKGWSEHDQYVAARIKRNRGIIAVFDKHLSDLRVDFRFLCPWLFFDKDETGLDRAILKTLRRYA
ncbi:hypothetical protein VE01_07702 [Pseudogymnoascus verrucosus]|uniref:Peptidase S8/S53 domain-containing protein n=1 Tax=Pseudogymnoascus verrucosus TaxID=342668 RepID=A0A1B8GET2_9PEZI|nr:uncharacterized protein VE01_07702 [Pseudogymnoascus verrucosus]OBT94327.2 hypothetical protein VE01_07702 [Pseudogymnoascus verrucosus]